jgi:tetraacyldisaccharide 4'-kinase
MKRLDAYWYDNNWLAYILTPLSWVFCALVKLRRALYRMNWLHVRHMPVPVIVVGNVSVGGTGKTPLVAALAGLLRKAGYSPGIVSRGYRGNARQWPQQVRADSDPAVVGDEAVMLARMTRCPIAVGPDRVAAAEALLEYSECNVILADDGLQHYALGRDIEIAVVDGERRFGNGHCLPAGPLREPASRLTEADFVVVNGGHRQRLEYPMKLTARTARKVTGEREVPLEEFKGRRVHAVAGIGHPGRFFRLLRRHGIEIIEHPFPDHHAFVTADLDFADGLPVLMTEKDAVKCAHFAAANQWYVPVTAETDSNLALRLLKLLKETDLRLRAESE